MSDWQSLFSEWTPVGSRVTCLPPPQNTDEDFLILSAADRSEDLERLGFECAGTPGFYTGNDAGQFRSWRRDDVNLILTPDPDFYHRFRVATALARRLNLLEKADRIALFQVVLYGVCEDNLATQPEAIF